MKADIKERRTLEDRRKFTYTAYVPERRARINRREAVADKFKTRVA